MMDIQENKLTKMIMGQEYDSESAHIIFDEEDIDWKIMNIRMTIDKTGKQHPSWIYTPLYTKDCIAVSHPIPMSVDQITLTEEAEETAEEVQPAVEEPEVVQIIEEPQEPIITKTKEYETISLNEEFDVELGLWKKNEAFRLIFDPTGKTRPHVEFLIADDVVDHPPPVEEPAEEPVSTETEVTSPEEDQTSCHRVLVTDEEEPETTPDTEDRTETPSTEPIDGTPKQIDEVVGQVSVGKERFTKTSVPNDTTFVLPDIQQFGRDVAGFIKDELIDIRMLQVLTINGGINWWADIKGCCKLFPLWILKTDTSLLSAINFATSGFMNYIPQLERSLHDMLLNPLLDKTVKQRWIYELWLNNSRSGIPICTSEELEGKWQQVSRGKFFQHLESSIKSEDEVIPTSNQIESIHIYMLANLLCRPIIILSVEKNTLNGIYLPFEQEPEKCYHFPIILAYHLRHFSALVSTDVKMNTLANISNPVCVPVMNAYLSLLPIHFITYPGADWEPYEIVDPLQIPEVTFQMEIDVLVKYLQLVRVRFSKQTYDPTRNDGPVGLESNDDNTNFNFLAAVRTNVNKKPNDYLEMVNNYVKGAKKRHKTMKRKKVQCKSNGCKNIPSSQLGGVCVKCYQHAQLSHTENH